MRLSHGHPDLQSHDNRSRRERAGWTSLLVVVALLSGGRARAQVLEANDDRFGIPFGATLEVEPFGVLENDLLDGENAGENGATASLVIDVSHGTLTLNSDGSFTYGIGAGFDGTDEFVYRAEFGSVFDEATVILSACEGGPDVFTCWDENAYLDEVAALGYSTFFEGFEDDAVWGHVRTPNSAPSVVSQGVEWRTNHPDPPASNEISTTPGPPHSGEWAVYDPDHGYATGTPSECDVDDPPEHCLYYDGFTGTREPGYGTLHGVGGYLSGIYGANVGVLLDGTGPIGGGKLTGGHQFFGVIDARPAGFSQFQFRELDGKVGQALFIWGDDFTLASEASAAAPEQAPLSDHLHVSPNPASRGAMVRFSLQSPARLRLDIFDVSGRLVRPVINENRPGGSYAIRWDRRDVAGHDVPSGIYFARMATTRSGIESAKSAKIIVIE